MTVAVDTGLTIGVLVKPGQVEGGAVQSIGRIAAAHGVRIEVTVQREDQSVLEYAQALQAAHPASHLLLLDAKAHLHSTFLEGVHAQIAFFEERDVAWGVIGNSGVVFPYFKPVRNMLAAGGPLDRFTGALPAAQLDPYVLLIHRDVDLAEVTRADGCPADAPISDLAMLAAWEAEKPCWICNLPIYLEGAQPDLAAGDSKAWARYLATRYNNPRIVSAYGTIELSGNAADAKDYYYSLIEPVLNRATRKFNTASVSVFVFATYCDTDIFDRCLMSIVSQFQRPKAVYLIGLDKLDPSKYSDFLKIIERYRFYLAIHWAEEDLPAVAAVDQFAEYLQRVPDDGYSMLTYDTCVLFPQAIRQICEFFQYTLRDPHVLPITTAETSRLLRSVETRFGGRPKAFFREVEKIGFTHLEQWLSSEPISTLHFTFTNSFLRQTPLASIDLEDLGSVLPQRLLAEPLSFFLIERGAGYTSFQKASPHQTISPLTEGGTPTHLANKAGALLTVRSNMLRYTIVGDRIVPALSWHDESETARHQAMHEAEFAAYRARMEHEYARLLAFSDQQETSLNRFRNTLYFRVRRLIINFTRGAPSRSRKSNL